MFYYVITSYRQVLLVNVGVNFNLNTLLIIRKAVCSAPGVIQSLRGCLKNWYG